MIARATGERVVARLVTAAVLVALAGAQSASAQLSVDVKNALTIGSLSTSEAGLEVRPAWSLEASVGYGLSPAMTLFGGYARTSFGCQSGFCTGRELKVSGNHGILGLELRRGAPFARVGLMYGKAGVVGADAAESGIGVRVGVGGSFGGRVRVRPGLSFSLYDASTATESANTAAFSIELGLLIPVR